ncbi:hypothetical protein KUTeg_007807 [Tegillarca granosa]|uniref:Uncharacterized protein n=1 Tax=Tegillarca granosa TaxID=220873 RepID=A0ABQ9FIA8_TEGGR|nr:hypothetical protein KUTeg_007807 [Tegillarca granosa]
MSMIDTSMVFNNFDDDNEECFLRRLSVYATVRPEDLKGIIGEGSDELGLHLYGKINNKSHKTRQSLQDLFTGTQFQKSQQPTKRHETVIEEEQTSSCEDIYQSSESSIVVRGSDIQDVPIDYSINGIQKHELPVIGVYLDRRICPGFKYKVRYVGTQDFAFDGEARMLESIGMGYGKRLTFRGERRNLNECYFWSDSHPEGFAFSLQAVEKSQKFIIYNSMRLPVGDATVESSNFPQIEESTECKNGSVKKFVRVRITCVINYHHRHHGNLMGVHNQDLEVVEGVAEVVKNKGFREASVVCINDVFLPRIGTCSFLKED